MSNNWFQKKVDEITTEYKDNQQKSEAETKKHKTPFLYNLHKKGVKIRN